MTTWPKPEGFELIPEGHYEFRLNKEPELKGFKYTVDGTEKEGRKMVIYAVGLNGSGEYRIREAIATFDPRYKELCDALKVEHGRDIQMEGSIFEADVKHEADKSNPTKVYPRLVNITSKGDDDIPF